MSLRTHFTLTADGKSVVTTAQGVSRELGTLKGKTAEAGNAAARANVQTRTYERGLIGARSKVLLMTSALGGLGTALSGKAIFEAGLVMDGIESSMRGAAGGAALAGAETAYLRDESERLGIVFNENVNAYAKMIAAGRAAKMEGRDIRDVFSAIAETGVVFDLSAENMTGALRAIEQMMSKGKVTAEELKLQLGDRLPGVMPIAAKAVGTTTAEFYKMLETGEVLSNEFLPKFAAQLRAEFGDGLAVKLSGARAEFGRMKNDLFELQVEAARGGFLDGLIEGSHALRGTLGDPAFKRDVTDLFNSIGQGAAAGASLLAFMAQNTDLLAAGVGGIVGLKFAAWLTAASGQLRLSAANAGIAAAANVRLAQSELAAARAAEVKAGADVFALRIAKARTAGGTVPQTLANIRLAQAETALAAATLRTSAAQSAAAAAASRLMIVQRGLGAAVGFLGGPLGVAALGVIGLVYAYRQFHEAQEIVVKESTDELFLMDQMAAAKSGLAEITRDNALALLEEAQARHTAATAIRDEQTALARALRERTAARKTETDDAPWNAGVAGMSGPGFYTAGPEPRVRVTQQEVAAFGLDQFSGFREDWDGGSFAVSRMQDVLKALDPDLIAANQRLMETGQTIADIRKRIEDWEAADTDRTQTELTNAQKSYAALRARMALEADMAGLSSTAAASEKLAQDLFNAAQKAGIDLTIEQARLDSARHVEALARAEAVKQWTGIETALEERLKAARETPSETALRVEANKLFRTAQAAGIELTREEIEQRLKNIQAIEDETEAEETKRKQKEAALETYEDWLEAREDDLKFAALSQKQREIERLAQEKLNLANKAGIEISRDVALAWAEQHLARIDQITRERDYVSDLPELYRNALAKIGDTWDKMWTDLYNGNIESAEDFGDQLLDMFKNLFKQIAAIAIIRPLMDASGLTKLLGINGGGAGGLLGAASGGGGGLLGGLLGGASQGSGGGVLGGLLGSANGLLTSIPGIGGILGGASGAITGALGALPGIGGALAGIAGALGPVGLIAGAVFGLTKLLKKTPRVKSYFGTQGGDIGIRSSETRGTDDTATQGIADQINTILDKLGVTLNGPLGFNVLLKAEKDYLGVNFDSGVRRDFKADQIEEAVTFTVSEILKTGVASGIDAGLQEAIRRAGTITDADQLDALISQYTAAQDMSRLIGDEIARRENPEQFQIDQLEAAQAARRTEIEQYRQLGYVTEAVTAQLSQLEALEMDDLLAQLAGSVEGTTAALDASARAARRRISQWLEDLGVANDNSPLSAAQRRSNAYDNFNAQLALAQGGDVDALDSITEYADTLLALDREATSSAAARSALYNQVVTALEGLSQSPSVDPLDVIIDQLTNIETGVGDVGSGVDAITPSLEDLRDMNGLGLSQVVDRLGGAEAVLSGNVSALLPVLNDNRLEIAALANSNAGGFTGLTSSFIGRLSGLETVLSGNITDIIPELSSQTAAISAFANANAGDLTGLSGSLVSRLSGLETVLSGNVTDLLTPLNDQISSLDTLSDVTFSGFDDLGQSFQSDINASNDNVIATLNTRIAALQDEVTALRMDTVAVGTAVSSAGAQQLTALVNLTGVNEDQVRLLEQTAGAPGDGNGGDGTPPGEVP